MPLKHLLISAEHGEKNPLVIGQYSAGFRSSKVGIQILKIKRIEDIHPQLTTSILNTC